VGAAAPAPGTPAAVPRPARIRFTKWVSRHLPAPLVYRLLIRMSHIPGQAIFRAAFAAADPGKLALDIGANRGIVSWCMSKRFAQVHAFEPNADLAGFLAKVLPSNCVLHHCALSDAPGETELAVALEGGVPIHGKGRILGGPADAGAYATQKIRLETLDGQGLRGIGIIKIDVEGHEEKVIRGGMETLRRERPVLVVEIEKRHTGRPAGETHRLIESLGYRGFFFEDGRQRPLAEYEERMQDPGYPAYINDFLFLPADGPGRGAAGARA
jgi:FkbM family methyltransferase